MPINPQSIIQIAIQQVPILLAKRLTSIITMISSHQLIIYKILSLIDSQTLFKIQNYTGAYLTVSYYMDNVGEEINGQILGFHQCYDTLPIFETIDCRFRCLWFAF